MGTTTAIFANEERPPDDLYREVISRGECQAKGKRGSVNLDCWRLGGHNGDHWDSYYARFWREAPATSDLTVDVAADAVAIPA